MENILDHDEQDLDSISFTKPNEKSENEDNNEDEDMIDGNENKHKTDFRRSLSSQDNADNDAHRRKDYRSKKEIEEEEREKMQ